MFRHESFEVNQLAKSREEASQSYPVSGDTSQIGILAGVLSRAVLNEPRFAHLMPDQKVREAVLPSFFASAIRASGVWGETFITPSADGGAIWIRPGGIPGFLHTLQGELKQLPFKLAATSLRRCVRLGANLMRIHERLGQRPHWYLLMLGVEPCEKRETIAAALICPVLARADVEGVSCYVETFEPSDLPFYEELGFRIHGSGLVAGSGPNFWIMIRAPRS